MLKFSRSIVGLSLLAFGMVPGTTQSNAAPTAGVGGRVSLFAAVPIRKVGRDPVRVPATTHLGAGQVLNVSLLPGGKGTARLHACGAPAASGKVVFSYEAGEGLLGRLITDANSDCLTATTDVYLSFDKDGDVAAEATPDRLQYVPLVTPVSTLEKEIPAGSDSPLEFGVATPPEARAAVVVLEANGLAKTDFTSGLPPLTNGTVHVFACDGFPTFPPYPTDLSLTESPAVNVAYVPLLPNSQLCLHSPLTATFRATLLGWLSLSGPDTNSLPPTITYDPVGIRPPGFVPTTPTRILDTRGVPGRVGGKFFAGTLHWIPFGLGTERTVSAVALNVTVDQPEASGFLTVYPCNGPQPVTSSLNYSSGRTIANAVTVKLPYGGNVCIFTSATTQVIVDFMGGYVPYGGSGSQSVVPERLLDTREAIGVPIRSKARSDSTTLLHVAGIGGLPNSGAAAVTLNVTVDQPEAGGFVTVYPCGDNVPTSSNLNYAAGQTVANLVTVKVGQDGDVCFYTSGSTHLIADLSAWYLPSLSAGFKELNPVRVLDSRNAVGVAGNTLLSPGSITTLGLAGRGGVPITGAEAVTMNVTVDQPQADGFLTVFPCGQAVPTASNLNYARGQTVANLVNVKLAANGSVCIFTSASAHVLADVAGYSTTTPDTFWATTLTHSNQPMTEASATQLLMGAASTARRSTLG
jgi:hypothetical protein